MGPTVERHKEVQRSSKEEDKQLTADKGETSLCEHTTLKKQQLWLDMEFKYSQNQIHRISHCNI